MYGKHTVAECVIEALAEKETLTAKELLAYKNAEAGRLVTLQAIYKELSHLLDAGVVLKSGQTYRLHATWINKLHRLSKKLDTLGQNTSSLNAMLPDGTTKRTWKFTNLLTMNDFWADVLLRLLQSNPDKTLLGWNPHPWFHLVQTEKEQEFVRALGEMGGSMYLILGSRTYLDRWAERFWQGEYVHYAYGKSWFHQHETSYINVIGDYVITVTLSAHTVLEIDAIYKETSSIETIDLAAILHVFTHEATCKLTLTKSARKAEGIRKKFSMYWGVSFS